MIGCDKLVLEVCFVQAQAGPKIFGFSEFISALALLAIVYTVTDIRYRFRVSVAPLQLFRITYVLIAAIGFGTLLTEIWLAEGWLVPQSLISHTLWQGILGIFFLSLAMTWIFYGFISPPVFNKKNYKIYAQALYSVILKGSDAELPAIASELARSAVPLVTLCQKRESRAEKIETEDSKKEKQQSTADHYAYDVLLLIGNRKLCRHIVASSPGTAMAFFDAMTDSKRYDVPVGQFAANVSAEAILNCDSILYHEDEGYRSGLIGYIKPFSQAVYGNYQLVESLASNGSSPLDIHYEIVSSWNAAQFRAYCGAVMLTLEDYLREGGRGMHSYALYRAIKQIESSCRDVYKLSDMPDDFYSSDIFNRLQVGVQFVKDAVDLIGKQAYSSSSALRVRDRKGFEDIYDHIAALMFEIIFSASSVKGSSGKIWSIHHNAVWGKFFGLPRGGEAWKVVQFKLRRLLYDEIKRLEEFPNYKSSSVLAFCLNVMGFKLGDRKGYGREYYALRKTILLWTQRNYLRLRTVQPEVAESCLIGSVTFDGQQRRLVKTYFKGLSLEAPKEYLQLQSNA